MKAMIPFNRLLPSAIAAVALLLLQSAAPAQILFNVNFGGAPAGPKLGLAATGIGTNDLWNVYRHYEPKFTPGMPLVSDGRLEKLKSADGVETQVSLSVTNAPGVWGNSSGDPMFDTYMFSQNGSNITLTLRGITPGRYHFYLYGHADPDVSGEQNTVFTLRAGTNVLGPLTASGGVGWRVVQGWQERAQFVVFRDVAVEPDGTVLIEAAPGPNGIAVINGLQILSRGTSPPRLVDLAPAATAAMNTNLMFREVTYEGTVSDNAARFLVRLQVESMTTNEISAPLFEGDLALVAPALPKGLYIKPGASGKQTRLFCTIPGLHQLQLELVAKIQRVEPWNEVRFAGPAAAIASLTATALSQGVEMQMLTGTQINPTSPPGTNTGRTQIQGFLAPDRSVALRWQSRGTEVARKSLVTADTVAAVQVTPTVIKFTTALRYEILQAPVASLKLALPASHALTRLQGEQIRDWQVAAGEGGQILTVDFIRPVEKSCNLTLFSEQNIETTPMKATLEIPRPLGLERESGSISVSADDTTVDIESAPGLRQVNAPDGALAAYRFNARPISILAQVRRVEPVLKVADHMTARVEETRILISHVLNLSVEKAGIYALDLTPQPGYVVTEVSGEGIDDWKTSGARLDVSFGSRVIGSRKVTVQLEKANREFPTDIEILPLAIRGVSNVVTHVGGGSSPGIRLKTTELSNLREIPINALPDRKDELLAFSSEQPQWKLLLSAEKLPPRVVSEVFNLVTIGDGLVGGSATIRYGIINQGVQEFRVAVPPHWKNLEFTGAMIRRKEQSSNVWTIALQDKAWGGYTLVITYDYQFDPKGATLDLAGAHTLDVERETGSLGIMTAASLKLTPAAPAEPLRRVDEAELSASDRSLCTRPLLLAYKYSGGRYQQTVQVTRFEEVAVLDAVADRTELTTVLTEEGQLLTQASFMVKNNEKQFQQFKLPAKATLWSTYVNSQPAKPEKNGDWYLVPLPRDTDRDQAFAVDIVYAQTIDLKNPLFPKRIELAAPLTDIPNTYAEWQLFAPQSQRVSGFKGNMTVASGTTYTLHDAWQQFMGFYGNLIENHIGSLVFGFVLLLVIVLLVTAARRGFKGAAAVLVVFAVLAILAAMMLPALSRAKSRAQRINAVNNLKQIGLAARTWSLDNSNRMPPTFEAMSAELGTDKITFDPKTGQRFVYVGAGKSDAYPEAIIAYSPSDAEGRAVLFADGSVQVLNREKFDLAMQRDAAVPRVAVPVAPPVQPPAFGSATAGVVADAAAGVPLSNSTGVETNQPSAAQALPQEAGSGVIGGQATATGVRPIRIEIPRAGQTFGFTKVLNTGQEPLLLSISMMKLKTYRTVQMVLQVCAFVAGLILLSVFYVRRQSLGMAFGVALAIVAVGSLLIMWRLLHVALILAVPALICALIGWAWWAIAARKRAARLRAQSEPPMPPPSAEPGQVLPLLLALLLPALGASAQATAPKTQDSFSLLSARYTGVAGDRVARFDVAIRLVTTTTNQTVPLFAEEAAVESFSADGAASLVRQGNGLALFVPGKGEVNLTLKMVARVGGDVSRRELAFGIPSALSSQVEVVIEEPEAEVEFPTAVAFEKTSSGKNTRVAAVIGAGNRFELQWTPRVKRAAEVAATVFAQNSALITLGGGVLNTRATLEYQVSQGELRQLRVRIPADQRVLRVEGESLRLWEVKDNILLVELLRGISPSYKLTVETERVLEKLPASVQVEIPHALDVKREMGVVAYRASEEVSLTLASAEELQRIDAEEFHRLSPGSKDSIASAFRFLKPEFTLQVKAETIQPQVEAIARQRVRIGADSTRLTAQVNYTIKRAGLFGFKLALPEGFKVESVNGGNIAQWVERNENSARVLEVTLKERATGNYVLTCVLTRSYREVPPIVPVHALHPIGTVKLTGFITVVTELGLAVKTASLDGLTEIPVSPANTQGLPDEPGVGPQTSALAYKFITAAPGQSPSWVLTVSTETVDPWVRAELMNSVSLAETLVSGRTQVKYEIVNAPIREFRLRIPEIFKNVEITGPQIRRRDQNGDEWRIELQGKVRGDYTLTITWELPKSAGEEDIQLQAIQALGVERETGYLAVIARPPLQATQLGATELVSRIDVRELPTWAGQVDSATVLAYRYLRPGYNLSLQAKRFEEAAVLQALIESARLTTVVADDGQLMTEMSLTIRNNGRQHLELTLPKDSKAWSAFVAGEPVRPNRRDGKLLLPLTREIASDAPITVEVTFVGNNPFPKRKGTVQLDSPTFDIPMKNARWDLFLPPDYEYSQFEGSMNRANDSAAPMVQVFSLSEYKEQQRAQASQQEAEVRLGVEEAKQQLSGGNLREAVASYNRAKGSGGAFGLFKSGSEFEVVQKDLRRAQSSNIISAQNQYYYENAGRMVENFSLQDGALLINNQAFNNDDVAGLQWDKLEKAQQVAVAKVSPLKVNLPTRGVHYSFSQVLQTETGKPMTLALLAENTKAPGWLGRFVLSVTLFALLWVIMAIINARTHRHEHS